MKLDPVALSTKLIAFPSITPIDGGIIDFLISVLEPLGFKCHKLVYGPVINLYARYGTGSPNFCFAGHTDVVPPGDLSAWDSDPFVPVIKDGNLFGRGAVDMKPAIASFIAAVSQFVQTDFHGSISLLITGDEEADAVDGTVKVLEWLASINEKIDSCIVGEPTNPERLGQMVKIGRRGSLNFKLSVYGIQGHVAYPNLADNPLDKMVAILAKLKAYKLDDGNEFFPPSNLEITTIDVANHTTNVIPAAAHARFNIRFNNLYNIAQLTALMHEICQQVTDKFELIAESGAESFLAKDDLLPAIVSNAIYEELGEKPELSTTGGTSDARFISRYCPVVEFGLINKTAHKVNEHVAIKDIENLSLIYLAVLKRYFVS